MNKKKAGRCSLSSFLTKHKQWEKKTEVSENYTVIVDALNTAVGIFTSHSEKAFNDVMSNGLQPIAKAAGLDRISIYQLLDEKSRLGRTYVWAQGKTITFDNEMTELTSNLPIIRWLKILMKGECVNARADKIAEDEAAFLSSQNAKSVFFVPIFTHNKFWGVVSLVDQVNCRFFDEDCHDLLRSAGYLCASAFMRMEMARNADKAIEALKRRGKLSNALNKTAITLLSQSNESFEVAMTVGVKIIADIIALDRLSVWRNFPMSDGLHTSQIYRWDREAGGTTEPTKMMVDTTFASLAPRWEKLLAGGEVINSPASLLPEAAMLKSFGTVSAFVTPVFMNNAFWGFVVFEDLNNERYFDEDYTETMRSAAFLCTNVVLRAEMERAMADTMENKREQSEQLRIRLEQQELISEISKGFISSGDSETYVKEAIGKLGRYHKVSQVFIFRINYQNNNITPAYYWAADGVFPRMIEIDLFSIVKSSFPERLPDCSTVPVISCPDVAESKVENFHSLLSVDIHAFIFAPLYVEGHLWGIISVEQCNKPRQWTENEKGFVAVTASTIAGVIMRNIYNTMLQDALHKATEASKAKGEFLSNMSHEMRTPLNAIIGMTSIGKNAKDLEHKDYALDKIDDASTHLLGVINDVLDMSKIEANMLELSPEEFVFEKMLQKVVSVVNFRIDEKKQKFKVNIDHAIPKTIIGDDQRLSQVITNLLGNAIKFTPEKGIITLETRLLEEKDDLCTIQISVIDSGIGISPEQQSKLFRSFQQAETSTTRKFGGTGLGLAISKSIVELMSGRIWIESEPEKGSTFAFTIQVKRGKEKGLTLLSPDLNISNVRIMVVDDDPEILEFISDMVQRIGAQCDTAIGGKEALLLIEQNGPYNIYFVDWKMPGIDGITLTAELKKNITASRNSVVIMISAVEWNVIETEAKKAGVDKFMSKPLFPSSIVDTISECLGMNQKQLDERPLDFTDSFAGHRILLAEDVEINREIVLTLLEPTHLEIDCAENGIEAVRKFTEAPLKYDMILMDVQMPEMDGYEATHRIRAFEAEMKTQTGYNRGLHRQIPIIAMTANVFREDIEKSFTAGMDDHIGKPLDFEIVIEKLRTYLSKE